MASDGAFFDRRPRLERVSPHVYRWMGGVRAVFEGSLMPAGYDPEVKASAIKEMLAERERTGAIDYARWERSIGVGAGTLRQWVSRARRGVTGAVTPSQRDVTEPTILPAPAEKLPLVPEIPDGLSPLQWAAMVVLLRGGDQTDAATAGKVSTRTIRDWMTRPAWRVAWDVESRHLKELARASLNGLVPKAIGKLGDVMDDSESPPATVASTAFGVLDRTGFGKSETLSVVGADGGPVQLAAALDALPEADLDALAAIDDDIRAAFIRDPDGANATARTAFIAAGLIPNVVESES